MNDVKFFCQVVDYNIIVWYLPLCYIVFILKDLYIFFGDKLFKMTSFFYVYLLFSGLYYTREYNFALISVF